MAGIGSTNAMKKGSGNNPFLAFNEADMRTFLNSAYVGCIVKYTGEAIQRDITDTNRTVEEPAQNIVFKKYAFPEYGLTDGASINIFEKDAEGNITESYIVNGAIKGGVFYYDKSSISTPYVDVLAWVDAKANNANVKAVLYDSSYRWHKESVNDQKMITLWAYSDDVTFTVTGDNLDVFVRLMYVEPYKVGELYKVVYGDGEYYFEEYYYTSEYKTTGNSDYIAPGKTMYDFTGELQTGNGSKVNPYIASTTEEMAAYLSSTYANSFVKYTGDTTDEYVKNAVYQVLEDGDTTQYMVLPVLDNEGSASDLAQGKQLINSQGEVVEGAAESTGDYTVKVIDYDGTVLLEKKGNTGDVIDLPTAPTHEKLVFQEWSASVAVSDNKVTIADNDIMVGAVYTTASGQNEFDITLTKATGLSVTLRMNGTKDWGDGTSDTASSHTYTEYGDYTIKCDGNSISASSSAGLFGQKSSVYNYYCTEARFATVTTITNYVFQYCCSLTNIVISNSVTSMLDRAFQHCYSLTSVVIPKRITRIISYMFYTCYSLTNVVIPNGVTNIGGDAFESCYSLTKIVIPNSVTIIDSSAFVSCYSLTKIVIPNSVTSIGSVAFAYCYSLTSAVIPNSVTKISSGAFKYCYSLTNIVIPDNVTSIESDAFYYCYSLASIIIHNNVTSIGSSVFYSCGSLTNIIIPAGITSIGTSAFNVCHSLTKYDFSQCSGVPTLSSTDAFNRINKIAKIIVPDSLYDAWIAASNWSSYANYIYKASEVA